MKATPEHLSDELRDADQSREDPLPEAGGQQTPPSLPPSGNGLRETDHDDKDDAVEGNGRDNALLTQLRLGRVRSRGGGAHDLSRLDEERRRIADEIKEYYNTLPGVLRSDPHAQEACLEELLSAERLLAKERLHRDDVIDARQAVTRVAIRLARSDSARFSFIFVALTIYLAVAVGAALGYVGHRGGWFSPAAGDMSFMNIPLPVWLWATIGSFTSMLFRVGHLPINPAGAVCRCGSKAPHKILARVPSRALVGFGPAEALLHKPQCCKRMRTGVSTAWIATTALDPSGGSRAHSHSAMSTMTAQQSEISSPCGPSAPGARCSWTAATRCRARPPRCGRAARTWCAR